MTTSFNTQDSELVIGLVTVVGTDHDQIYEYFEEVFNKYNMNINLVKVTDLIKEIKKKYPSFIQSDLFEDTEYKRIESYMDAGTEIRNNTKKGDILALNTIASIYNKRSSANQNKEIRQLKRTAHIIRSLKHPDEVQTLKDVYGSGFYLVGISSSKEKRLERLENKKLRETEAIKLISRDQEEEGKTLGQQTRKTFELSDFFIEELDDGDRTKKQIERIVDLIFGHRYITPNQSEHAMFLAYAMSLRSADLSRQVGAVVVSKEGEVIAMGANDVPKAGGGQYWPGNNDKRDYKKRQDSNQINKKELMTDTIKRINKYISHQIDNVELKKEISNFIKTKKDSNLLPQLKEILKKNLNIEAIEKEKNKNNQSLLDGSRILDITEYGRIVHAEMEALTACSRIGVSPKGGTLFVTTCPCHNCAKHIVDAGIAEVIYVEPYPKSQAKQLHSDSIDFKTSAEKQTGNSKKVIFKPFVGVGPRRFFDLFSIKLGSGTPIQRKDDNGKIIPWKSKKAEVRVQLQTASYIDREERATELFNEIFNKLN